MSFEENRRRGNRAVALLATCFVVLGGCATCTLIAVFAGGNHPEAALLPIAGVMAGTMILLWLLREEPAVNQLKVGWSWLSRRTKRRVPYWVRAKLPPLERHPTPPTPPTVETIRQITGRTDAGSTGTWVSADAERQPPSAGNPTTTGL